MPLNDSQYAVVPTLKKGGERLMEFLTALNQDVEIIIRPRTDSGGAGHIPL